MKKKILIAVLILAIALSVVFAFTIGTGAEEADPALSIGGKSLILGNSIYLRYMVAAENVASIDDVSLLVWNEPQEAFVKGTEKYEVKWVSGTTERNGTTYYHFEFQDVAAKRLADDFYAVVYTKVGENEYYSKADKYSVLKYAYNMMGKLDKAASTNTKLLNMLDAMLDYGATAQYYFDDYRTDRLANDDYYQIKVEGGKLPDGFADGLYLEGDLVTITADAPADGYKFAGWKKESTCEIAYTDATATIEVGTANEVYTATYAQKYSDGLKFTLRLDKKSYKVTGIGTCTDLDVLIPPTYQDLPVTEIGYAAFNGCKKLTSITIPESVTSIDASAFSGCKSITKMHIPASVVSINAKVFEDCTGITEITVDENNPRFESIDGNLYYTGNNSIMQYALGKKETSFVIPDGVTLILNSAFAGSVNLTSVTIPESVTSIAAYAFYECRNLKNVVIVGNSITGIQDYAFQACNSLEEIIIPDSTKEIGTSAFWSCNNLKNVHIGDGVTKINQNAFYYCRNIKNLYIGSSLTTIYENAFYHSNNMEDVYYNGTEEDWNKVIVKSGNDPLVNFDIRFKKVCSEGLEFTLNSDGVSYSVTGIGSCTDTDIVIPSTYNGLPVTAIGANAFRNCDSITSVTIPDSVITIGFQAFTYCSSLTSVIIGNGVTTLGYDAFSYCTGLTSVTIPDSVTTIGTQAFYYCTSLASVNVTDIAAWCNIEFADYYANPLYYAKNLYLNGELVTELLIPEGVTTIGYSAFYNCTSLTSVTIGDSVTTIGTGAFYGCTSLTSVTIPDSVTSIGSSAFSYCTGLTSVTIPDSVTTIGTQAFYCCKSLTSVTIPDSVTSIGSGAFYGCTSLTSVYITDIAAWCNIEFGNWSANPIYYAKNLYLNGELVAELVIPGGVTSIGSGAFCYCTSLTSITIPDSVTTIGSSAFERCSKLTSVTIPDSVTTIGDSAFEYCDSLTSVTIPDSVTSIGDRAFYICDSLTSVTIPDSVTSIGSGAFYGCTSLTSITVSPENANYKDIDGNLYTKDGKTLIQYATGKKDKSFTIPNSVTSIGSGAFKGCTNLTSVTIPNSVTTIGGSAFSDCESLTSVTIPNSVTTIGEWAFAYCYSLTSATIGNNVTTIGEWAFSRCTSLTSVTIPNSVTTIGSYAFRFCISLTSIIFEDTSTWYRTTSQTDWENMTGGTGTSVTNSSTNANYFKSTYYDYYWYKE